jgi:tetratricopeptide (TPR) repeat protein
MKRFATLFIVALIHLCVATSLFAAGPVKVWEEQITIPTYVLGPPDPNPQFYLGGASQGAQHRIYPYPVYDNLTTEKADKNYQIVYLENEYVRVGILPEIGGRIFEAVDKTNGYYFFYRQHVIKPALISLLGAWISGGVEWDIPHHHRATSFLPVQHAIQDHSDGSKTVWIGELELRDRMRWAIGVSLRPGRSYLEVAFRITNRTPVATSMLCFSNVAVHVNDDYQIIFPPRTQHVTYHGKRDFTTWPIATTRFNNADFTAGVDVSWYKNHESSNSMFAWNYEDDFFAGYDHGKRAGTMSVADHTVVPGKKFWTWGTGPRGRAQDTLLTDSDGPYIELMVGAFSDNQPDYSWLAPYETRQWTQYWYPFREIGGVKNANTDAAVNLELKDGKATIGFYTTADHSTATASLTLRDTVLFGEQIAINPGRPFVKEVTLPAGADVHELRASLAAGGKELVGYSPIKFAPEAMPPSVTPFPPAAEMKTNEELYLAGLRIEQFHAPNSSPEPYWEEALKRDPNDVRVNTALGIRRIKGGRFAEAEAHLRKAVARATDRYTTPKDGEHEYYLGLALKAQGKLDEAATHFYRSTWSAAWRGPGYFEAAQIESARGETERALVAVEQALEVNQLNSRALALKAALGRRANRVDQALLLTSAMLKHDPLDVRALAERWLAAKNSDHQNQLVAALLAHPAAGLEIAADYFNAGLWQDGESLVAQMTAGDKSRVSPLAYYYLGYVARQLDRPQDAANYYRLAAQQPTDYVFPFQMEMIAVLEDAMRANPTDSRAPYYLGNLLYDWQPERALALWEKSADRGADFPTVYRNLALVYARQESGREKALAALEKAVSYGGSAMVFNELDRLYEENGVSPETRLALLEKHQAVINRDDVISREINLKIFAGKPDDAISLLKSRFFRSWEGGASFSLGDSWINAHLVRGHQKFAAKQYKDALAAYQAALEMPANLQEATGNVAGRRGEISYWIARAHEALGNTAAAQVAWRDAAEEPSNQPAGRRGRGGRRSRRSAAGQAAGTRVAAAASYYQALALQKSGNAERATALFQQLIDASTQTLKDASRVPSWTNTYVPVAQRAQVADAYYLAGLGHLGLANTDKAMEEFNQVLKASPDHVAAIIALKFIAP